MRRMPFALLFLSHSASADSIFLTPSSHIGIQQLHYTNVSADQPLLEETQFKSLSTLGVGLELMLRNIDGPEATLEALAAREWQDGFALSLGIEWDRSLSSVHKTTSMGGSFLLHYYLPVWGWEWSLLAGAAYAPISWQTAGQSGTCDLRLAQSVIGTSLKPATPWNAIEARLTYAGSFGRSSTACGMDGESWEEAEPNVLQLSLGWSFPVG